MGKIRLLVLVINLTVETAILINDKYLKNHMNNIMKRNISSAAHGDLFFLLINTVNVKLK